MYLRRAPVALLALTALALLLPSGCATKNSVTNPRVGPAASFSATPLSGDRPLDVDFVNSSTPGSSQITTVLWDFGDGTTSAAMSPGHTYVAAGTYTVSLTVTSADGSSKQTKTDYIVVTEAGATPPNAIFSGTPTAGHAPLTVQFTDASTPGSAPITGRVWRFGDGGTSTATNPSHIYLVAGTYTVTLTVTTTAGSNTATQTGYIIVHPTPVSPTANFSGTPTAGPSPLLVQFSDLSVAGTSPITAWSWTFGDGGTSSAQNPSHTYASPGNFAVSLQVTTADGQNTKNRAGYIQPCQIPVANFSGTPVSGLAPLTVRFTDQTTGGPNGWAWNFGDGTTNATQNPSHVYSTPGTYTVSLKAQNACGSDSVAKAAYITVGDPCPNPIYSFPSVNATSWSNITNGPDPGYRTRGRLTWNTNVSSGCVKSVFAKIYTRPMGDSTWTLFGSSACYSVSGNKTTPFSMFLQGLPKNCYDIRIDIFECGKADVKATRGPADDTHLTNQCFEL